MQAASNGEITLQWIKDVAPTDMPVISYLCTAGVHWAAVGANPGVQGGHINMPAIPIQIVGMGPLPPIQQNHPAPTPDQLRAFARRLAVRRRENEDLRAGIYMANEMVGIRYDADPPRRPNDPAPRAGAPQAPMYRHNRLDYSPGHFVLPKPRDHNYIQRMLEQYPEGTPAKPEVDQDLHEWWALGMVARTNCVALLAALYSIMMATVLIHFNITVADLIGWCSGRLNRTIPG